MHPMFQLSHPTIRPLGQLWPNLGDDILDILGVGPGAIDPVSKLVGCLITIISNIRTS